jgi:hypothetical protein
MTRTRSPALLLLAAAALLSQAALAKSPECQSGARYTAAQAEIDAALKAVGDVPSRHRARLALQLKASPVARGWSAEQQAELIRKVYSSPRYLELERQKEPQVAALMHAVASSSGSDPEVSKCAAARQVRAIAWTLADIHNRQYAYAAREAGLGRSKTD